jgi:hypothetical protein
MSIYNFNNNQRYAIYALAWDIIPRCVLYNNGKNISQIEGGWGGKKG